MLKANASSNLGSGYRSHQQHRFPPIHRALACLVLALLVLIAAPCRAQQDYVVGVEEQDFYPYYRVQDGAYHGFARDLLDGFARSQGIRFTYRPLPVRRLFKEFLSGPTLDFKFPDDPNWSADEKTGLGVVYSQPAVEVAEGVAVLKELASMPRSDIKVLGTIRGFTVPSFEQAFRRGTVQRSENSTAAALIQQALAKPRRIDGIYVEFSVLRSTLKNLGLPEDRFAPAAGIPVDHHGFRLATRKHAALIAKFDEFMVSQRDYLTKLQRQYGISPPPEKSRSR